MDLPRFKGRVRPEHHRIGLIVDCETTGGSPERNAMVEVGLVSCVIDRRLSNFMAIEGVLDAYTGLCDPGEAEINPIAMRINGLHVDELRGKSFDTAHIHSMIRRADLVIAHNASFDRRFFTRAFPELADLPWHCTYYGVPWRDYGFPGGKLRVLCEHYGIRPPTHRAMEDARATYQLLSQEFTDTHTVLQALLLQMELVACPAF